MSLRGQVFVVAVSIVLLIFVLNALRRRQINEEYCLWWIGILVATDCLVLCQPLLLKITHLIGAQVVISTLTLFAMICIGAILIYFTMKISVLTNRMKELIQTVALQNREIDELRSGKVGKVPD